MVQSLRHLNGTAADNVLSRDIRDRPLTAGPRSCDEQWIDRNRHRTRIRVSAIGTPGSFMPAERVTASLKGFGCRPEHERSIRYKAGVRKPRKKEPAGKR